MHLVGLLSSYFAHDARSQEPKAITLCSGLRRFTALLLSPVIQHMEVLMDKFKIAVSPMDLSQHTLLGVPDFIVSALVRTYIL